MLSKVALIVDSESRARDQAALTLSRRGFLLKIAKNHRTALCMMAAESADVVVIDTSLPEAAILEFGRELRSINPLCKLVLLPRRARKSERISPVVTKPLDSKALLRAIERDPNQCPN